MPEMPDLDETTLAKLARERAMNIKNVYKLFEEYGIDEDGYRELVDHNPYFKRLLDQYTLDWNATTSTADRVRIESYATLEQLIPFATRRAMSTDDPQPLASLTSFGTLLAKAAGIGDTKANISNNAEKFVITINIGDESKTYEKNIALTPSTDELITKEISNDTVDPRPEKEDPFDILWAPREGGEAEREGSW